MKHTIRSADTTRATVVPPTAPEDEEADEIRGMMPSFHVWDGAQHALVADRAEARHRRDLRTRARAAREVIFRRRWSRVIVVLAVIAAVVAFEKGSHHATPVTASTSADQLSWRDVVSPSGAFRVSLPAAPATSAVKSVGVPGEQLESQVQQTTVTVRAFQISGANAARALVLPMIDEQADAFDGAVDDVRPVGSRVGEAYEGVVQSSTTTIAIVRIILDGPTLFFFELRGDVGSLRAREIFDRVLLSFAPLSGH